MLIDKLEDLMSPLQRQRWRKAWQMFVHPEQFGAVTSSYVPYSPFLAQHAQQLVDCDIAHPIPASELAARPTLGAGRAFVVKEQKNDGFRLRPIFDPAYINDVLDASYVSDMGLAHVSCYLDPVLQPCAATGDLRISFFQIAIPRFARQWFRFTDETGALFEMCRLPMGHKVSAELMQIATETLAGVRTALAVAPLPSLKTTIDVWIDGFRIAGPKRFVADALKNALERAELCNATWKEPPAVAAIYDFIGVRFDHVQHTVAVAAKTLDKIGTVAPASALKSDYEKLVARLIFASGVLRAPPACYYWAIKMANRYANALNRGEPDIVVTFPFLARLQRWIDEAHTKKLLTPIPSDAFATLYTDASLKGWGAYLFMPSGQTFITGAAWPGNIEATPSNIGELEAIAVANAVELFRDHLLAVRNVEFKNDNSSVAPALRRALARAPAINDALVGPLRFLSDNNVKYTVSHIASAANLADAPSRLQPTRAGDVLRVDLSRGRGGRV